MISERSLALGTQGCDLGRRTLAAVGLACVLLLTGCGGGAQGTADMPGQTRAPMESRSLEHVSSPGCEAADVDNLVKSFFASFNAGQGELVERYVAAEPGWAFWRDPMSRGEPVPRPKLEAHLLELQKDGVRLQLKRLVFRGHNSVHNTGDFTIQLGRTGPASQVSASLGSAKGAIDCTTGRLAVMTIDSW